MRLGRGSSTESAEVRSAVVRHLVFSAIALVVVSVPTYVALGRIAEHHALESAAEDGASIARRLLAPAVTDALLASDPDAIRAMDRRLVARMSDGSLSRVKIWLPDGQVVYSDEHRLIGRTFPGEADLAGLRPGGRPISAISQLDEEENVYESTQEALVEVYTLSGSQSGKDVVYEMYFPLSRVQRERDQLLNEMAPVMLALCLLALSQLPLAVGLARRVSIIRRSRQRLLAQTVTAVELERTRLAQDLHDDVIQDLSGVAVALESVARTDAGRSDPAIERAADILRRDVGLLREIVSNLFPVTTHHAGLDAGLRELVGSLRDRGVHVELHLDPDPGVDPVTAGLVYRVAREAIVNVAKHAGADTCTVRLVITDDAVDLEVRDDGRGIENGSGQRQPGHVGLEIVSGTIAEAGGTVDVMPGRPRGTTVRAHLPR